MDKDALIELADELPDLAIEAACQARNMVHGTDWKDGMTVGLQVVEKMLAERMVKAALRTLAQSQSLSSSKRGGVL